MGFIRFMETAVSEIDPKNRNKNKIVEKANV
jgi:hypothetical protein